MRSIKRPRMAFPHSIHAGTGSRSGADRSRARRVLPQDGVRPSSATRGTPFASQITHRLRCTRGEAQEPEAVLTHSNELRERRVTGALLCEPGVEGCAHVAHSVRLLPTRPIFGQRHALPATRTAKEAAASTAVVAPLEETEAGGACLARRRLVGRVGGVLEIDTS